MSLDRILIPLDGSELAEAILPQVHRLLLRTGSEVLLLQTVPYPPDFHIALPTILEDAHRYVRRKTFELVNSGIRARGLVEQGLAAGTILDVAARESVSLVAMSTHGRTGLSRWAFGSVAEKVLRASPAPLLLLRSFRPGPGKGLSRGKLQELPFRNILVPVDGREASLSVLSTVLEIARPIDAHVTLLCVHEPSPYEGRWDSADQPAASAQEILSAACIPVRTELRKGDAALEILRAADDLSADLIAMSTHGRSGPSRWVLGSVTEKVLHGATVPMLVARRKGEGAEESARHAGIDALRTP
jgi:nucleotide-binding universal stress UspA family protein